MHIPPRRRFSYRLLCWLHGLLLVVSAGAVRATPVIEVQITGIEDELLDNALAFLQLNDYATAAGRLPLPGLRQQESREFPGEAQLQTLFRRGVGQIREALQPFGYYQPVIRSQLDREGERWIAVYRVERGPPVRLSAIDIRIAGAGSDHPGLLAVRDSSTLRTGDRLLHSRYKETRSGLIRAALAAGYLDAHYTRSELRVTPGQLQAEVVLHLDTGERYFFGDIRIEQDILDPAFIERFVDVSKGEPFNSGRLLDLQLKLGDSGYFERVDTDIRRDEAQGGQVPVVFHTEPAPYVRYTAGVGFATDTGARISLGANYARVNRLGHGLATDARVSQIEQIVSAQYRIPIRNLLTDRLVFSSGLNRAVIADEGETQRLRLGVSRNTSRGELRRRLYLDYQHEDFSLGNEDEVVDFLIPGYSISRLHTDNVLFPRRGYSWNIDLRGAPGLISSTRFVRTQLELRGILPLGERGRVIARGTAGASSVDDFTQLPSSERFFAGGDQSVRGYGYQELAPVDSSGEVIGGQYLATVSLEADYLVWGNFGGAVFYDAGNADDNFLPALKTAAGIGFRWRSPVGMLRIDLAHPFDSDEDVRLHISIGPEL